MSGCSTQRYTRVIPDKLYSIQRFAHWACSPSAAIQVGVTISQAGPIFDPLSALLMLVGLALAVRRFRQPAYGFIIIWLAVMFVPGLLAIENNPNHLRTTGVIPAIFILPALGAAWLWEAWESRLPVQVGRPDATALLTGFSCTASISRRSISYLSQLFWNMGKRA